MARTSSPLGLLARAVLPAPLLALLAALLLAAPARAAINPDPCVGYWVCVEKPTWTSSLADGPGSFCRGTGTASWRLFESVSKGYRDFTQTGGTESCPERVWFGIRDFPTWGWVVSGPDGYSSSGLGLTVLLDKSTLPPGSYSIKWSGFADIDDLICPGRLENSFTYPFTVLGGGWECREQPEVEAKRGGPPDEVVKSCEPWKGTLAVDAKVVKKGREELLCGGNVIDTREVEPTIEYQWSDGLGNGPTAAVEVAQEGRRTVTCRVTFTPPEGSACDDVVTKDVSWTIDVDIPQWECVVEPTLIAIRTAPADQRIETCFAYAGRHAVGVLTLPGLEGLMCHGQALEMRLVRFIAVRYQWQGVGMGPQPLNQAAADVALDDEGRHTVSCRVTSVTDGIACGAPSDRVEWTIDIDGWRCLTDPVAQNLYELDPEEGGLPEPAPIVLLRLGRTLSFDIPIGYESGIEVCGPERQADDGSVFYDHARHVPVGRDETTVQAGGDGVSTGTNDETGVPWVRFDRPGQFTVTVTATHRYLEEDEDDPYVCPLPGPTEQVYVVIVAPPVLGIDGDNTNGPAAEEPPPGGGDGEEAAEPPPPTSPPAYARPDLSQAEEDVKRYAPGKIAYVNRGDWDSDQIPDWSDGFDNPLLPAAPAEQSTPNASASFVPVVVRLPYPGGDDPATRVHATLGYSYLGWRDRGTGPTRIDLGWIWNWWTGSVGVIAPVRLWTKDGGEARRRADVTEGGDLVRYFRSYTAEELGAVRKGIYYEVTLYAEVLAHGGTSLSVSATVPTDSGADDGIITGISTSVAPQALRSFEQTGAFEPFVVTGLGWDRRRFAERDRFFTWTIDASTLDGVAYVLRPDNRNQPFRFLDGDVGAQRFTLGPQESRLKVLGALVPDPHPFDGERSVTRAFMVEIEGLRGATAETRVPVTVEVTRPDVTITPRARDTRPARIADPAVGGDASLLGVEAEIRIGADIDLRSPRRHFTASGTGTGNDVSRVNFTTDLGNTVEYDAPIRGLRYGTDGRSLLVMGAAVGGSVVRCTAIINDETNLAGRTFAILDVPLVVTPVATGEMPDPQDLTTIVANVAKRRVGRHDEQVETPEDAPPTPPGNLLGTRLPGNGQLPTDSARAVYAWYVAAMHVAGQILPHSNVRGPRWVQVFGGDSAAPFGSGTGTSSFSQQELQNALMGFDGASPAQVEGVLALAASPADAWRREHNIAESFGPTVMPSELRRQALELRAKHALEFAALQRLKLHFCLTRDASFLPLGPWDVNVTLGGAVTIREEGFWESLLHTNSPVESLFDSLYESGGITYRIGNPLTEDVIEFMLVERLALARSVFQHLLAIVPQPQAGHADWPFVLKVGSRTFPGMFANVQNNYEFYPTQLTLDALREAGIPPPPASFFPTEGTWVQNANGRRYEIAIGTGVPGLYQSYGTLMSLTLREIHLLKRMQGTAQTAEWWRSFRTGSPIGYTFFMIGDFFFGLHDLQRVITGVDPITGEPLTPAQYAMSAGMTLLNFLPGSALLAPGKRLVGKLTAGAVGKGVVAGAARDIAGGTVRDAAEQLGKGAAEATTTVGGELAARRAAGQVEHLGADGVAAAIRATDGVAVDTAEGLYARHGITSMTDAVTAGKAVRQAPSPARAQYVRPGGGAFKPPVKSLAKDAARNAEECARLLDVEDTFGRELARSNPKLYAEYLETTCFAPGTLVAMADGTWKAIEAIAAGDRVLARDQHAPATTTATPCVVLGTFAKPVTRTVELRLADGGCLRATADHPVRLESGWAPIGALAPGDRVLGIEDDAVVEGVRRIEAPTTVHNLRVGGSHTYFVLPSGSTRPLWVHNRCVLDPMLLLAAAGPGLRSPCPVFDEWLRLAKQDELLARLTPTEQFEFFQRWRVGSRADLASPTTLKLFAHGPGISWEGSLRDSLRLAGEDLGWVGQGHHLLAQGALREVPDLFKARLVRVAGVDVPVQGVSLAVHHFSNGVVLPFSKDLIRVSGLRFAEHSGAHPILNKVQQEIFEEFAERLTTAAAAANRAGSIDPLVAAVREVEQEMARMQLKCRRALITTDGTAPLPLFTRGGPAAEQALERQWRALLEP